MPRANRRFLPDHAWPITHRCLVYVDLNMVRAGMVKHPGEWPHSGYGEIQHPPARYAVIDLEELSSPCGFAQVPQFQQAHRRWVAHALAHGSAARESHWSEAVAIGSENFVERVKRDLGIKARYRELAETGGTHVLRERTSAYTLDSMVENEALTPDNTVPWQQNATGTAA